VSAAFKTPSCIHYGRCKKTVVIKLIKTGTYITYVTDKKIRSKGVGMIRADFCPHRNYKISYIF